MTKQINFKKIFTIFFITFGLFALVGTFMGAWGDLAGSSLLERLMLTGLRERLFTDLLVTFRSIGYLFLATFHLLLALWVYTDCQKKKSTKRIWVASTFITGLIGYLIYMLGRKDSTKTQEENFKCQS